MSAPAGIARDMNFIRQSTFNPAAGSGAELIGELGKILYVGAGILFVLVVALAAYGVFGSRKRIDARQWMIGGGVVLPFATLSALLIYSLNVGDALEATEPGAHLAHGESITTGATDRTLLRIHVIGKQWWWDVRYASPDSGERIVLANELHIPTNESVEIVLSSADVIHSFWAPSLAGKVDMIPGRETRIVVRVDEAGVYRGQCAEYCGAQHALMAFFVVVESRPEFDEWLARQARSAVAPADEFLRLGHDSFLKTGCRECHAVRGIATARADGPDLTHVGGRQSLAAGILRNHVGAMAGWIAGAQDIKPGNRMPSAPVLTGQELRALSAWLASLE
jgi:cytochrome c oxidase subunit 2